VVSATLLSNNRQFLPPPLTPGRCKYSAIGNKKYEQGQSKTDSDWQGNKKRKLESGQREGELVSGYSLLLKNFKAHRNSRIIIF
jgi:hypothetical protein